MMECLVEVFHKELKEVTFQLRNGKWYCTTALLMAEMSFISLVVGVQSNRGVVTNTYLPLQINRRFKGVKRSSFEVMCLTF